MDILKSASDVIDALGGTAAMARLTSRRMQSVSNWRAEGRLPAETFLVVGRALEDIGKSAPPSIWGIAAAPEPARAAE